MRVNPFILYDVCTVLWVTKTLALLNQVSVYEVVCESSIASYCITIDELSMFVIMLTFNAGGPVTMRLNDLGVYEAI